MTARTLKRRIDALSRGDGEEARRFAIIDREIAKRFEQLGIPEQTEAESAAFERAFSSAKPADWDALTLDAQAAFFIRFSLEYDRDA